MIRRLSNCGAVITLTAMLGLVGCTETNPPTTPVAGAHREGDGHDLNGGHPEEGPHHGHLIELGQEEFHAELTHDEEAKSVTVYLLDNEAENAVPIAESEIVLNLVVEGKPLQVRLAAAPQDGDPQGQASRFSVVDETVLKALEVPKTTGRLTAAIGGKAYTGSFEHLEHDVHQH